MLSSPSQVVPFAHEVQVNADKEKDALGFLPASVYEEEARKGNLLVAVTGKAGRQRLTGYLLFGGQFPHCRIFQVFVLPGYRRQGIAKTLVNRLVSYMETLGYLSIGAQVADNLKANEFWEHLDFQVVRQKLGGVTKGRRINVRVRELDTPRLFSEVSAELGLVERIAVGPAVYAIDLNVFWDVANRRPRSEYAAQVVAAAFANMVRIVVTAEFVEELERSSAGRQSDPALEFAEQLPTLSRPDETTLGQLITELRRIVFPNVTESTGLSTHNKSDLIHIATAIHHSVQAFVTSDEDLLQARELIHARWGVKVLRVSEFASALKHVTTALPSFHVRVSSQTLSLQRLSETRLEHMVNFFEQVRAPSEFRRHFLSQEGATPGVGRYAVYSDSALVCLASWDAAAPLQDAATVWILTNEENPAAETAVDFLLGRCGIETTCTGPILLELRMPRGHVLSKGIALVHGFRADKGSDQACESLQKMSIGHPVIASNWASVKASIKRRCTICLPGPIPSFVGNRQAIPLVGADKAPRTIALNELENLLSPTLLLLPGRTGCLVPIRPRYAEQLLAPSKQLSLLPAPQALLLSRRVYFCAARSAGVFRKGLPLVFYESGTGNGRSCGVAIARVVKTEVVKKSDLPPSLLHRGVIELDGMDNLSSTDTVTAVTFDNVMVFRDPVKLLSLRRCGAIDRANLVTSKPITHEQLVQIVSEAYPNE